MTTSCSFSELWVHLGPDAASGACGVLLLGTPSAKHLRGSTVKKQRLKDTAGTSARDPTAWNLPQPGRSSSEPTLHPAGLQRLAAAGRARQRPQAVPAVCGGVGRRAQTKQTGSSVHCQPAPGLISACAAAACDPGCRASCSLHLLLQSPPCPLCRDPSAQLGAGAPGGPCLGIACAGTAELQWDWGVRAWRAE